MRHIKNILLFVIQYPLSIFGAILLINILLSIPFENDKYLCQKPSDVLILTLCEIGVMILLFGIGFGIYYYIKLRDFAKNKLKK